MKKRIGIYLCLAALCAVTGCGKGSSAGHTGNQTAGVDDVLDARISEEEGTSDPWDVPGYDYPDESEAAEKKDKADGDSADSGSGQEKEKAAKGSSKDVNYDSVDIDLSEMSSTMVYTEVYNMMDAPKDYVGKVIKMKGTFNVYHDSFTDKDYFGCIIRDATACCSQGIEFLLTDDYTYPDDYPEEGSEITVVGVFNSYKEGDNLFYAMRDAKLV